MWTSKFRLNSWFKTSGKLPNFAYSLTSLWGKHLDACNAGATERMLGSLPSLVVSFLHEFLKRAIIQAYTGMDVHIHVVAHSSNFNILGLIMPTRALGGTELFPRRWWDRRIALCEWLALIYRRVPWYAHRKNSSSMMRSSDSETV